MLVYIVKVEVRALKRRRKRAKKRFLSKKRLAIFGISVLAVFIIFTFVLGFGGLFLGGDDSGVVEPVDKETGKINALIVGVDSTASLTDTIMVVSYDLDNNSVDVLSIPRDTRMYVGSRYQKINTAYSISKGGKKKGINGTIDAVTRLTGIPINYYAEFSFDAFRETIDALGGVYFDVPQNMKYSDPAQDLYIDLKKGYQLLDGEAAEEFVRFRRYPMGDIDRVAAQQAFIKAVAEQKLNASIIPRLPELFKTLQKNLKTNITAAVVARYVSNLGDLTGENVHMHALPGTSNSTDYGASYWIADMDQLKTLIQETFGYDASKITIHSADGKSISKDVKIASPTPSETPKPSLSPSPSVSPTPSVASASPKPTKTPKPSAPTQTVSPTREPTEPPKTSSPKPTKTPDSSGIKRPSANPKTEN